jgi:hypothetical protein
MLESEKPVSERVYKSSDLPKLCRRKALLVPWEKYTYSPNVTVIINTFWYDPLEFMDKTIKYYKYKILVLDQLKLKFSSNHV